MISGGWHAYGCASQAGETLMLIAKTTIPGEVEVQSDNPAFGYALLTAKRRLALTIVIAVIAVWHQATFCSHQLIGQLKAGFPGINYHSIRLAEKSPSRG